MTEEFIDIEQRLKNKKEVQRRYIEILQNKAKTVEDVLAAEDKIRIIQEEIESREGRLRYLKDNIALSTINIEMYQELEQGEAEIVYEKGFFVRKRIKSLEDKDVPISLKASFYVGMLWLAKTIV